MRLRGRCQAVMNRVCCGQSGGFEAESGKQRVRLHQAIERRRDHLSLQSLQRGDAILQQCPVTEFGQRQSASRRSAAPHVADIAVRADLCFEPRRERIPHARYQQPRRTPGDHFRIHQNQIGIPTVDPVFLKHAFIRVDYRERAARGIARRHGWAIHHR